MTIRAILPLAIPILWVVAAPAHALIASSVPEIPVDALLCQSDTVARNGHTYGWVNRYVDSKGRELGIRYFMRLDGENNGRDESEGDLEFDAEWNIADGRLSRRSAFLMFDAVIQPMLKEFPIRVEVWLDGEKVGESRFEIIDGKFRQFGMDGRAIGDDVHGVQLLARPDGTVPNLFGHERIEVRRYAHNGELKRKQILLLPDWRRVSADVRRAARRTYRANHCGPQVYI